MIDGIQEWRGAAMTLRALGSGATLISCQSCLPAQPLFQHQLQHRPRTSIPQRLRISRQSEPPRFSTSELPKHHRQFAQPPRNPVSTTRNACTSCAWRLPGPLVNPSKQSNTRAVQRSHLRKCKLVFAFPLLHTTSAVSVLLLLHLPASCVVVFFHSCSKHQS